MSDAAEFSLIEQHFSGWPPALQDTRLGVGDDAAIVAVPSGYEMAVTTDSLHSGIHFPEDVAAFDLGWKALAVNLSDLAAMGAQPRWFTAAVSLPQADADCMGEFAAGMQALALEQGVQLIGGDTCCGPKSATVTAMGLLPAGSGMRRSGARVGDLVAVTGTLGDAALGLELWIDESSPEHTRNAMAVDALFTRLNQPSPRCAAGMALRDLASAAIDLSDGIAADIGHIARASGVGAQIRTADLPSSDAFLRLAPAARRARLQACGGDDYELCVCLAPADLEEARSRLDRLALDLQVVGSIVPNPGVRVLDLAGNPLSFEKAGYQHFS